MNDKEETLEDAAELYKKLYEFRIKKEQTQRKEGFIDGAKWYQERSYTIEDLKNAFEGGHISARQKASYKSNGTYYEDLNDWIHEYKKVK